MGKECPDDQGNAAKKQVLLHVAELLEQEGLISWEEKNAMKTIIYQQYK